MRIASSIACACACAVVAAAAPVRAQNAEAAATIEFDKGRALLKQGKYAEACAAFERSQKLDPQSGTLFNIGECNEGQGKIASAWVAYRDLAQRDTNAGRKREALRRAAKLEKRLPKLLIKVADPPDGLHVEVNDNDATSLVGIESPVDLGDYKIRATAPGYAPYETTKKVDTEGKTTKVRIELEPAEPTSKPHHGQLDRERRDRDEPTEPVSHRRRNGVLIAIAGGAVLGVGAVFGLHARSEWNDAQALCEGNTCPTVADKQRGDDLVASARSDATKSTIFVIGGAAIASVGIYLYVTAKPARAATALRIVPTSSGAAVVLGGRF